jgi:small subunit ribosomal protein S4e
LLLRRRIENMVKNHIKRIAAPKTWRVLRKTKTFITRPSAGGHKLGLSVALNTFLKELAKITGTTKETKYLLTHQEVRVNGERKRSDKYPIGYLDVVSVPSAGKTYRLVLDAKGMLAAKEISAEDADRTILMVTGKTIIRGGKVQLHTLGGRNIIVTEKDSKTYRTGDSLLLSMKDGKVESHIQMGKGALVFVFRGKHSGNTGHVENIAQGIVRIITKNNSFETKKEYALATGTDKPALDIEL